jgi:ATP-dependent RNA helicase DeaD
VTFVRPEERRKLGYMQNAVRKSTKGEMKEEAVPSVEEVLDKKRARLFDQLKIDIGLTGRAAEPDPEKGKDDQELSENDELVPIGEDGEPQEEQAAVSDVVSGESENAAETSSLTPGASLITPPVQFADMAAELCSGNEPQRVLAAVMSVMYGKSLDKKRYGTINGIRQQGGGRGGADDGDQMRLYVQMGRRDGYNPRAIADYFSDLLHIPGRFVDRIDISANFTLLSLPAASAKKALELSKRDSSIPHMHADTKDGGFDGGRNGTRGDRTFREDRGGRRSGFGERGSRDSRGKFGRSDKSSSGGYSGGSYKSHGRPNVHTPTERSGSAGLYRRKSAEKAERF